MNKLVLVLLAALLASSMAQLIPSGGPISQTGPAPKPGAGASPVVINTKTPPGGKGGSGTSGVVAPQPTTGGGNAGLGSYGPVTQG